MSRHFEKMGYIQKEVCTNIHQFEKALVQGQEWVKVDWATVDWFLLHKKALFMFHEKKVVKQRDISVGGKRLQPSLKRSAAQKTHVDLGWLSGEECVNSIKKGYAQSPQYQASSHTLMLCFLVQSWVGVPTIRLNAKHYLIYMFVWMMKTNI